MKTPLTKGELTGLILLALVVVGITLASTGISRCGREAPEAVTPKVITIGKAGEETKEKTVENEGVNEKKKEKRKDKVEKNKGEKEKNEKKSKRKKKATAANKAATAEYRDPFQDDVTCKGQDE